MDTKTSLSPLSQNQIEQFLNEGHIVLRGCFSRESAAPLVDDAWQQMGYDRHDASTWSEPLKFMMPTFAPSLADFAPQLWGAMQQLVGGADNLNKPDMSIGQWVVNLWRGRDEVWTPPSPQVNGWHVDGIFFRHFLDSPEQCLLVTPLFSDVAPRGGGTVFAPDSIAVMARFLAEHPEGVLMREFPFKELVSQCRDFRELTGEVGDAVIFHPLMLHSFSQNHSGRARFITNIGLGLREPMRFEREDNNYSSVERAILRGLNVESLDWKIRGQREIFDV